MNNRNELFEALESLFIKYFECNSARKEKEIQDRIFKVLDEGKNVDLGFDLSENQLFV